MAKKSKKKKQKQPKPFFSASDDVGYGIGPTDLLKNPTKADLKQAEEYQDAKADFIEGLDYKLPDKEDDSAKAFLEKLNPLLQQFPTRRQPFGKLRPGDITPAGTWVLSKETLGKLDPIYEGIPDFLKLNQQESIYERRESVRDAHRDGVLDDSEFERVMHNIDIEENELRTRQFGIRPMPGSVAPDQQERFSEIFKRASKPKPFNFSSYLNEEE